MNLDGKGDTSSVAFITSWGFAVLSICITFFALPETMKREKSITSPDGSVPNRLTLEEIPDDDPISGSTRTYLANYILRGSWVSLQNFFSGIGIGSMALLIVSISSISIGIKSVDWLDS